MSHALLKGSPGGLNVAKVRLIGSGEAKAKFVDPTMQLRHKLTTTNAIKRILSILNLLSINWVTSY
jgi:hypothetical protein